MQINYKHQKHQNKRGFVLLYTALVSSMLLAIALAVYNINIKELLLSSTARESQFAFYAADVGTECALFHDFQNDAFSVVAPAGGIDCAGATNAIDTSAGDPNASDPDELGTYVREFTISDIDGSGPSSACVAVVVTKDVDAIDGKSTSIESRGLSSCDGADSRRVERAIRSSY
jgi:hypothetical protein